MMMFCVVGVFFSLWSFTTPGKSLYLGIFVALGGIQSAQERLS